MITIDEMHDMLDSVAEEFPEEFFEYLNGGISLLPETKLSPHARGDDLYVLGEYHHDTMGRYIYIYYGSFQHVHGGLSPESLRKKLWQTVAHEFTHHLESLAGDYGLEVKDAKKLSRYLKGYEGE